MSDTACASMTSLVIPDVSITSASLTPAGTFTPPGAKAGIGQLPTFCRVIGVAKPTNDSLINFEIWTPSSEWNGKYLAVGNNAFLGAISFEAMGGALLRGYATASSDAGHTGGDLGFAVGHPEKIKDWAWRANHVTSNIAKLVIRNLRGRFPSYSYFQGCDSGGHQALAQAQRFPDDYDGIVAGNPASNRTNEIIAYLRVWRDTHDDDGKSQLPLDKMKLLYGASVAACDMDDGVADGVIDDPRTCDFKPETLLCKSGETEACLTDAQLAAAKAVYAETRNPRTGDLIFAGWPFGSEAYDDRGGNWNSLVNGAAPRRVEFFNNFVFQTPEWDWRTFDFDKDVQFVRDQAGHIDAIDPDLSSFKASGGKLIVYTGWADPILPGEDAIHYYDAVIGKMGGAAQVADFLRLYMVPGMGHCSGGPGASSFDMLSQLERWIERKEAPQRVIASRVENGAVTRTRPLCPHPQTARWTGKGSTDDATNFICTAPQKKAATK